MKHSKELAAEICTAPTLRSERELRKKSSCTTALASLQHPLSEQQMKQPLAKRLTTQMYNRCSWEKGFQEPAWLSAAIHPADIIQLATLYGTNWSLHKVPEGKSASSTQNTGEVVPFNITGQCSHQEPSCEEFIQPAVKPCSHKRKRSDPKPYKDNTCRKGQQRWGLTNCCFELVFSTFVYVERNKHLLRQKCSGQASI